MAGHHSEPAKKLQHTQPVAFYWFCGFLLALDLALLAYQWGIPIPLPQQIAAAAGNFPPASLKLLVPDNGAWQGRPSHYAMPGDDSTACRGLWAWPLGEE